MLVEPLLCRAQLFYNGHKHTMFRSCAVRFGQCATTRNPDGSIQGTVYLTGGNAGETVPFTLQPMPDVVLSKIRRLSAAWESCTHARWIHHICLLMNSIVGAPASLPHICFLFQAEQLGGVP